MEIAKKVYNDRSSPMSVYGYLWWLVAHDQNDGILEGTRGVELFFHSNRTVQRSWLLQGYLKIQKFVNYCGCPTVEKLLVRTYRNNDSFCV